MNLKAKLLFDFITLEKKVSRKKKIKEDVVPNTQTLRPAQKREGLQDLLLLCHTQAKCHKAIHYRTKTDYCFFMREVY